MSLVNFIYKLHIFSQPRYLSPETILGGLGPMSDIWNLGILLLELYLGPLWTGLKPGPVLRRIMSLLQTPNPAQRIAREHDAFDTYSVLILLHYFIFTVAILLYKVLCRNYQKI